MTTEEIKRAGEVMIAFAEGKKIEVAEEGKPWRDCYVPSFNWDSYNYRIKPEPKYRPFQSQEECWNEMQKHSDLGWLRDIKNNNISQVLRIGDEVVDILGYTINTRTFEVMFQQFKFTDGTPFGIKEE